MCEFFFYYAGRYKFQTRSICSINTISWMIFTFVEALTEFDAYFNVENILPHKFLLICSPLPTRGLVKRIIIMRELIIEWLEEDC